MDDQWIVQTITDVKMTALLSKGKVEEVKASTLLDLKVANFADFGQIISTTSADSAATNDEYIYWGKVGKISVGEKASSGGNMALDSLPARRA